MSERISVATARVSLNGAVVSASRERAVDADGVHEEVIVELVGDGLSGGMRVLTARGPSVVRGLADALTATADALDRVSGAPWPPGSRR